MFPIRRSDTATYMPDRLEGESEVWDECSGFIVLSGYPGARCTPDEEVRSVCVGVGGCPWSLGCLHNRQEEERGA